MSTFAAALRSSIGKKYLMGLTGLIWVGFAMGHLTGNLLLFAGREAFNNYAFFLETVGHGVAVYIAEAGLILALLVHIGTGIQVVLFDKPSARPRGYEKHGSAGGRSRKGLASMNMIVTGILLLVFLVVHIITFKFGAATEYVKMDGRDYRDLYSIVIHTFANPAWVAGYVIIMLMLGTHLYHGIWSAFQSLGLLNRRTYPVVVTAGTILAVLLAVGFLFLPVTVYVMNDQFMTPRGGLF